MAAPSWCVAGQRVVRVDFRTPVNRRFPVVRTGQILTIGELRHAQHPRYSHILCLGFEEIGVKWMWPYYMFRPVRPTSIACFEALLRDVPISTCQHVEEDA